MSTGLVHCATCRFWDGSDARAGVCRRHAPWVGEKSFEVARWPETRPTDGCGEGQPKDAASETLQTCGDCLFWDRPGVGIDPAKRGDRLHAWWHQAGWCRRYAPRPGVEIGEHGFWRVTHATSRCYDGRPKTK